VVGSTTVHGAMIPHHHGSSAHCDAYGAAMHRLSLWDWNERQLLAVFFFEITSFGLYRVVVVVVVVVVSMCVCVCVWVGGWVGEKELIQKDTALEIQLER
jgi:hypothetical protein